MENNTLNPATGFHELYNVTCISLQPSMLPCNKSHLASLSSLKMSKYLAGWWFQPLWKILVSWDDYSQYMGEKNDPNHQASGQIANFTKLKLRKFPLLKMIPGFESEITKICPEICLFPPLTNGWPSCWPRNLGKVAVPAIQLHLYPHGLVSMYTLR